MDLKVLVATCMTIFLAEMGDKTQLAVFGGTAATRKPLEIFLGATLGLLAATAIGVVLGQVVGHVVSPRIMRIAGGALFVGIGLWLLLKPAS
jgi:putative Ca2+/H+ antiporter (TMEM165/GDT1 family)